MHACRQSHSTTAVAQQQAGRFSVAESQVAESQDTPQNTEGSAATATLARLGWPALCEFVARFASTTLGRQHSQQLHLPEEHETTEQLVLETAAVDKLEIEYAIELDFGGTSTQQVSAQAPALPSAEQVYS